MTEAAGYKRCCIEGRYLKQVGSNVECHGESIINFFS